MKRDLIVFGEDWAGLPSSTQHLIKHLSKDRKVIWINSIGLRKPKLNAKDALRLFQKLLSALKTIYNKDTTKNKELKSNTKKEKNISIYTLFSIPAPKYKWERLLVKNLLSFQIKPLIRKHKLVDFAIWTSLPTASDLSKEFTGSPYIYYCGDDFSGLEGVDHETADVHEKIISENAKLIIASSKYLENKFPEKKTQYLSHGVDFELFSTPSKKADDLPNNGNPTAGFYGSIASWLDLDLIELVAKRMSHWNFVFIGEATIDVSKLSSLKNIFFLGPRQHSDLPKYSQHWDASLLPFKNNAQIRACNPLKLKEYLAAGAPIIASEFPAALSYKNQVSIIKNAKEMCEKLQNVHTQNSKYDIFNRQETVKNEAWQAKAEQVGYWVDAL